MFPSKTHWPSEKASKQRTCACCRWLCSANTSSGNGSLLPGWIQDSAERAAFERWGDLTAQLIRKYGPALLEKLDAEEKCSEYDAEQTGQAA